MFWVVEEEDKPLPACQNHENQWETIVKPLETNVFFAKSLEINVLAVGSKSKCLGLSETLENHWENNVLGGGQKNIEPLLACPNHGNYCKPLGEINVLGGGQKHECGEMLETVPQS